MYELNFSFAIEIDLTQYRSQNNTYRIKHLLRVCSVYVSS